MTIVLVVFATILGALWQLAATAWKNAHREQTFEAITSTVNNVRATYAGNLGIPVLPRTTLIPQLYNQAAIPVNLKRAIQGSACLNTSADCMDSPMGYPQSDTYKGISYGTFEVCNWVTGLTDCQDNAAGVDGTIFAVKITDIDYGTCIMLGAQVSGASGPPGLLDVSINSSNVISGRTRSGTGTLPVAQSDLQAMCTSSATPVNTIAFVYRTNPPAN